MKLVKLRLDCIAEFVRRPNRFVAEIRFKDKTVKAHVHDSGRLSELLYKGNNLLIKKAENKNRKTAWDVIAAWNNNTWVLINTYYHRKIFLQYIKNKFVSPFKNIDNIKPEYKFNNSRLDFLITDEEEKIYVETKGVTLLDNNTAIFPDAPTKRGRKHLKELIKIKKNGNRAAVFFLIFLKQAKNFLPNYQTDIKFTKILNEASEKGVEIYKPVFSYDGFNINYEYTL